MTSSPCQVCGSPDHEPYPTPPPYKAARCRGCGFIWLDPLPTDAERAELYSDPYEGATTSYFAKVDKKMRRSRGRAGWLARRAPSKGRFLDVGCSGGFMVESMRERGFEAHGLDLDSHSIDFAKKTFPACHFVTMPVEPYAEGTDLKFDAIYSSEVIEHVTDANGFIAAIASLLKPGGVFFVTTPDINHWRRPKDLLKWDGYSPPSHCLYFGPKNMPILMARHGMKLKHRRPSFKPGIKMLFQKAG